MVISHRGQDFHSDDGLKWKVVDAVCATNKYHRDLKSDAENANESSPVWLLCAVSITSCSSIRSRLCDMALYGQVKRTLRLDRNEKDGPVTLLLNQHLYCVRPQSYSCLHTQHDQLHMSPPLQCHCSSLSSRKTVPTFTCCGGRSVGHLICRTFSSMLLYVHRDRNDQIYLGLGAQDGRLDFHTAPEL